MSIAFIWISLSASVLTLPVVARKSLTSYSPISTATQPCNSVANSEFDKVKLDIAIQCAQDSQDFGLRASRFERTAYTSSFMITKWGINCVPLSETFNPVFSAYNQSRFAGYIVVSENPATLSVFGVGTQMHSGLLDYCLYSSPNPTFCNNGIWAGFEGQNVHGDLSGHTISNSLTTATANFWQAQIYYPPTGCANFYTCNVAEWLGLEDAQLAYPDQNLAQIGTTATCQDSGCLQRSMAGYELYPNPLIQCDGFRGSPNQNLDIWPADELNAYVQQGAGNNYNFGIYDYRSQLTCISNNNYYPALSNPTHAAFELENFKDCFYDCDSLAKFSGAGFNSAQFWDYYLGRWVGIGSANQLWKDHIVNCNTLNVTPGAISGSNLDSFDENWLTSQYTPYWNHYC
jgi:hypothetical protein